MEEAIAVIDFGGQYAHLIARRIRQLGVFSEILVPNSPIEKLKKYKGIILSGGPSSVTSEAAPAYNSEIFNSGIPILGLCYGLQLITKEIKGEVKAFEGGEYGRSELELFNKQDLFHGLKEKEIVWMSHGDQVSKLPQGFEKYASTKYCEFAAIGNREKHIYGLQFHPEVTHTPNGQKVLENFVKKICNCKAEWKIENYIKEKVEEIREQVKDKNVFMLVSGGVDSLVALTLMDKALEKERVYALHIDTGFMRKNESMEVVKELNRLNLSELHIVDASDKFLEKLKGITDPEEKRKIMGKLFVEVATEELKKLNFNPDDWLLGQGTIYPDTIETGRTEHAAVIKTHHNRIELLQEMEKQGKVVEPLNLLYKDEVRELGRLLGLKEYLVKRHPFPGPGLGIRIICSAIGQREFEQSEVYSKFQEIEKSLSEKITNSDYQIKLLPVRSVGVQGDNRTYEYVAMLFGGRMDFKKLEEISTEITNTSREVNRVVYLIHPEKVDSLELLQGTLTRERADLLREADSRVMGVMELHKLLDTVWQFPVILAPISINGKGESIVLRPIHSMEAMTAQFAALPIEIVNEMIEELKKINGVGAVMYDITHKPPATICWE